MKNQYVSGIALLMLLAACQQELISEQGTVENTGIRIQASISDQPESRTTAQTSGETTFDPNDEIGFFMPEEALPPDLPTIPANGYQKQRRHGPI